VLFGENWNNPDIDVKTRCIITVVAVITHVAFYAGWPKGWAVFRMAKEVWADNAQDG
jgi:4-carboxymuconolactone decarboxylase